MEWVVLLVSVFGLVFSGLWLGIALGGTGWIVYYFLADGAQSMMGAAAWSGIQMYSLIAVGCFIFMGHIVLESGIGRKVYACISPLMERVPGALLHTNIIICALFASIFGSSAATSAVVGSSAFPELRERGYDRKLTLGTVAAGGTLGIMIPPSGAFIIYGALTEISIGALFAAGIIPGIMLTLLFSVYIALRAIKDPEIAPRREPTLSLLASLKKLIGVWPIAALIALVLIPIFAGWTTATESSSFGVFGALILGILYGDLTIKNIIESIRETTHTFIMLMFLILGAMILANSVGLVGLPRQTTEIIGGLDVPRQVIIVGIALMYLGLGCLFDGISFMVMTLPFVFPIIKGLGYGGIWFGVLLVILTEIGQLTPPVGINLYIIQGIAGDKTSLEEVVQSIWPFFWILLGAAVLLIAFPKIATFLPALFGYEIL